jgi:hypothetical protein
LHLTDRRRGCGHRAKTWFTPWASISAAGFAGTGNQGTSSRSTAWMITDLVKAGGSQITAFAAALGGGLYASSSNLEDISAWSRTRVEGTYEATF